jgi:hypothetical protein
MDYKAAFLTWYENEFKETELYRSMKNTVEASQWHREENVAVHTDMVGSEYIKNSPDTWSKFDFMGAVQCAIHDIGKPVCMSQEVKEDGSIQNRFKGHELTSGMMWIDYIMGSRVSINQYLSDVDIYNIGVIAQNHLPYSIGVERAGYLKKHLDIFGLTNIYIRCLISDGYGRISDNHEEKSKRMLEWLSEMFSEEAINISLNGSNTVVVNRQFDTISSVEDSHIIMMVGCSGSGKSTFVKGKSNVHSLDSFRLEYYNTDYQTAFQLSCKDKVFATKAMQDFYTKQKLGKVYLDNTNLTIKMRNRYKVNNTTRGAIVLLTSFDTNLEQLVGRNDNKTN